MSHGFIHVSEPLVYLKNQHININKHQNKMICLLKGKLKRARDGKVLSGGEVVGLEHIINLESIEKDFLVLEESTIVAIEGFELAEIHQKNRRIIRKILLSMVDYINDVKENLLKGTTACRP